MVRASSDPSETRVSLHHLDLLLTSGFVENRGRIDRDVSRTMTPRPSVSRMRRFTPSPSSSVRSSIDQRSPSHSARSPTVPRSNGTLTRSSSTRSLASSEIYNLNSDDEDDDGRGKTRPTPVPYRKVLALSVSRVTEGMIWAGILPYVNAMMRDIGVAEHDVGIWSAVAVSRLNRSQAYQLVRGTGRGVEWSWTIRGEPVPVWP